MKKLFNQWINNLVSGTHNHFACYLPKSTGLISQIILKLFFINIKIPRTYTKSIQDLEKKGIVILVNKYKSYFEYLFYHLRYQNEGILHPGIGFDYRFFLWQPVFRFFKIFLCIADHFFKHFSLQDPYKSGFIQEKLISGETALLSLVEKKGFYRRFVKSKTDPLHYLIEIQKNTEKPIIFLPHLMFFSRTPRSTQMTFIDIFFGTQENPGKIRRLIALFKSPKKIFIETSEPIILRDFLNRPDITKLNAKDQAVALRRYLLTQINAHRQTITGPILKSKLEIQEEILTNQQVQEIITDYARDQDVSIHQAHKQAVDFLDEIAADYSPTIIRMYDITLKWMFKNIFEGMVIDYNGLDRIRQVAKKGPLILVPCHKSHLDYLIISWVFLVNNIPCPLIAAGKNLSFWPLGPIFRGGGAFFLRRTFKGDLLYPKIFAAYIKKVLDEGFHLEFFIEGGRSRTGKMLTPKIGLLSLLMDAFAKNDWDDMTFVPIYIGYDRVLEEKAYINEIEGGKKNPENLKNVIKARKFLKRKYGKIYLNFHEPFSLKEYLSQQEKPSSIPAAGDSKTLYTEFGKKLIGAINQVSLITPHAVVAGAILNCGQKRFDYNQLMAHVNTYMTYLLSQGANLADTLLWDRNTTFKKVLDAFADSKMIEKSTSEFSKSAIANPLFKISDSKRPGLDYYKNNGIIAFIPAAFTALAILKADAFQFSSVDIHVSYKFLQEFFENEFILDPDQPVEYLVRKNLKAFIDDAIIMPHQTLPDTYNLTSAGYRKLNLYAAFLVSYFESYWIVLNFYKKYTKQSIFDTKDYIKKIQSLGNRMYKRKEVERTEALSKINYKNAVTFFTSHGLTEAEKDKDQIEFYTEVIQKYRRFLPH
ncbi:MAG: 1-acyl-sn-glycerol-3-phosphate acyltransferase [Desulfobacteraceae bacterium]|nr:1-acyl-sn-glycerol-3-phosphate acyltransferase [Desulfobacteraceae bacterium]